MFSSQSSLRGPKLGRVFINSGRDHPHPEQLTGANLWTIAIRQFNRNIDKTVWARELSRLKDSLTRMAKGRPKPKRNRTLNPADDKLERARDVSKRWHGRETKEIIELAEEEKYNDSCAVLGFLCGLSILSPYLDQIVELEFHYHPDPIEGTQDPDTIKLVTNLEEDSIELIDGNQNVNINSFPWLDDERLRKKDRVVVGKIFSISYFTDKHHLEGPKSQSRGTEYEHEFAEEISKKVEGRVNYLPSLVIDTRNKKLLIEGGAYTVTELGLAN